jgi:hypothetical protein
MRKCVKILTVLAALSALLVACRTPDKAPESAGAPAPAKAGDVSAQAADGGDVKGFIAPAALRPPPGLKPLGGDALGEEIDLDDYTLPTDAAASDGADCTKQRAGNVHASKNAVWISTNVDVTDCANAGATTAKYSTATLSLVMLLRCPGVDLSQYDGTPYAKVSASYCKGATSVQGLLNAQITGPYVVQGQQGSLSANVTFQSATMTDDGSPCLKSWSGDTLTVQPCNFLTATIWTGIKDTSPNPASNLNTFKLRRQSGLTGTRGQHFFDSGAYQLQIGNWTGALNYAGGSQPPTWSMSNGGQSENGVWQDPTQASTATGTGTATGN